MIRIGLDPGKYTGLAVYDSELGALTYMQKTTFCGAYSYIVTTYPDPSEVREIVIEVSATKHTWQKAADVKKLAFAPPKYRVNNIKIALKIANDVGGVRRESELLALMLENAGFTVTRVEPTGDGKELNQFAFKRTTGWPKQTNPHTRDAAMLVWKRNGK